MGKGEKITQEMVRGERRLAKRADKAEMTGKTDHSFKMSKIIKM